MAALRHLFPTALVIALCAGPTLSASASPLHDLCRGELQPLPPPNAQLGEPTAFLYASARLTGSQSPELLVAQRALERDLNPHPATPEDTTTYQYVEVDGWRSPELAAGLSAVLPGTGQLYAGAKRGYVFLGIQALAVYTYLHFDSKADENRNEAFAYAGDPASPASRWSFDRYEQEVGRAEADRMRAIYESDPAEFYSRVSTDPQYFAGWAGNDESAKVENVAGYRLLDEDRIDAQRASRLGLFTAIANSVVSAVDAFRQARLNNIQIEEDWNVRFKAKTGHNAGFTAFVTHHFH